MRKGIVGAINEYNGEGDYLARAFIVKAKSSSPRNTGTEMIIYPDGSTSGTIGGGRDEAIIMKKALELMEQGKHEKISITLTRKEAAEIGWVCGGAIDVFIELIPVD